MLIARGKAKLLISLELELAWAVHIFKNRAI
jgi:hypothetical protein